MKILFTGGSSFSGMWFVQELVKAGHSVTVVFRRDLKDYEGIRKHRVEKVLELCPAFFSMSFGDEAFLQAISQRGPWNLYCHHAAEVADYRSPHFDFGLALLNNTRGIKRVMQTLKEACCSHIVLTGSVFEQREGAGSGNLSAVSPYGLSKGLTSDVFAFYAESMHMKLGKFVIPNPFGPFEEGRFTTYLIHSWLKGQTPVVKAPDYVRDNIPVSLLAKAYTDFAEKILKINGEGYGFAAKYPSCYVGSQGDFTRLMSVAMRPRLGVACNYELLKQQDFSEPMMRINTDSLDWKILEWDEIKAWDRLAEYFLQNVS